MPTPQRATAPTRRLPPPPWGRAGVGGLLAMSLALTTPAKADTATVVTDHARPAYAAFAEATAKLAALDTCDTASLQPAFHAAYDAWMPVADLRLGPSEDNGRALAILFWPDPKRLGAKAQTALLAADPATLTPAAIADQSVAARGLTGLERLLYPAEPLSTDPCPLIHATADDLAQTAADLATAWGPYGDQLLTAGDPGNTKFLTRNEATQALFTQIASGLEFLSDRRIARPLGTFDAPRPDLAEGQASGRAMANITLSLKGLRDLSAKLSPDSAKTLAAFDHAIKLAEAIDDPTLEKITDPQAWLKLQILQQAVQATRDSVIAEVSPALGVKLGFNAADGD